MIMVFLLYFFQKKISQSINFNINKLVNKNKFFSTLCTKKQNKQYLLSSSISDIESNNKKYEQKIIFIKSNVTYDLTNEPIDTKSMDNLITKTKLLDKKIIYITPGGLYGFYDTAICKIIKDKYNLDDYIFNGASAGSWNSLLMVYKYDHNKLIKIIFDVLEKNKIKCIKTTLQELKNIILSNTNTKDYELDKLFITVCVWNNNKINNYVYTDFETLECAINCCIASSNIPVLTGDMIHRYMGKISYDGGFLSKSHVIIKKPEFIITNSLFGKKRFFTSLFDLKKNISQLYNEGLTDCLDNLSYLDDIFEK